MRVGEGEPTGLHVVPAGAAAGLDASPFDGFWMGGFEGADHVNGGGTPLDMARLSGHWDRLDEDHRRAARAGLRCVRESIGWRLCEAGDGTIDLTRALRIEASARRHGLQVLWTLMHYGVPPGLSLHDDAMIERLARFGAEAARVLGRGDARPPIFTPVNEIGYLAWAASQPGLLHPPNNTPSALDGDAAESSRISGYGVKRRLARASIAAMHAIRGVAPNARFLHVEPLIHVVAPPARPDLASDAERVASWQWQAWDLLAGRLAPELGGSTALLDLLGANHYHSSQWEFDTEERLDWWGRDPRRRPFSALLAAAWQRYRRPLIVAETGHVGVGRAPWLDEIVGQVRAARRAGVPVHGVCVYPIVDRPDWQRPAEWHRSGLWHVDTRAAARRPLARHVEPEMLASLRRWQRAPAAIACAPPPCGVTATAGAAARHAAPAAAAALPTLLVFSHLRWDFVRHRTRHLLERLAAGGRARVVVVEEPLACDGDPWLDAIVRGPALDVLVPHAPRGGACFDRLQQPLLQRQFARWLTDAGLLVDGSVEATAWLTTPMAWPLVRALDPLRVVYDCADELAAFLGAPADLPRREAELLAAADLVLAAGPELAAPRRQAAGARLVVLPNGVDRAAFARRPPPGSWDSDEAALIVPPADAPCVGYAGVVDERLDLALLAALADARPQWRLEIVGPLAKIERSTLPQRANLHWLGEQPYRLLPALVARWQLAIVPFVDGPATRHAQPLKVFEALAAGLGVVATGLGAFRQWGREGVHCVADRSAFVAACDAALAETPTQRCARRGAARRALRGSDWHLRAARVEALLGALPAPAAQQERAGVA